MFAATGCSDPPFVAQVVFKGTLVPSSFRLFPVLLLPHNEKPGYSESRLSSEDLREPCKYEKIDQLPALTGVRKKILFSNNAKPLEVMLTWQGF